MILATSTRTTPNATRGFSRRLSAGPVQFLLVLLLLQSSSAWFQSLAELARQERERKAQNETTARVYTNDDIYDSATSVPPPPPPAPAKPVAPSSHPLTVDGTFTTGFYTAYTKGGGNESQRIRFVPAGASFEINGYYLTPDLLDYWFQPHLNVGPQASDAGFQGDNGLRTRITFLRRRAFPVTFRYSNVQLKDVYFGSLTQLSTYSRNSRNKDLGVSTELKPNGLPVTTIDWGTSSVNSESGLSLVPDYVSHSRHFNVDSHYERWGWDMRAFARRQHQSSDLFIPFGISSGNLGLLEQQVNQIQGSVQRMLPWDSQVYFETGNQSTENQLFGRPIDLTTHYTTANLRTGLTRKWKNSFRANYTSNLSSLLFSQLLGGLEGSGTLQPPQEVLLPFERKVSYLNLNALSSIDLAHGLGLYASADRTTVLTPAESGLGSSYLTSGGGITYAKQFSRGSISGQYGRSLGKGAVTGQAGTLIGENYAASSQVDAGERLRLNVSVRGTRQKVSSLQAANERSLSADTGVEVRVFSELRTRIAGGLNRSNFSNAGNEYHIKGFNAQVGILHPRFQINGSLNSNLGNSLQVFGVQLDGLGVQSLLPPLRVLPSNIRGWNVTLHANPLRRMELTALYTRSTQHLDGVIANDFTVIDGHLTFNFRRIQLEVGFFRSNQIFSSYLATYPETQRGRFYIRIVRKSRIL
jgi:hypothetical protein